MMKTFTYKNFIGSAEIDIESGLCVGKILFINDLVTYQSATPAGLKAEFESAVDDYLDTCKEIGKSPEKSLSGVFNVRISPEDHRRAAVLSLKSKKSLNSVISDAVHWYLDWKENGQRKIEHKHSVEITLKQSATISAGASQQPQWRRFDIETSGEQVYVQ